jgi:hypothetical protein
MSGSNSTVVDAAKAREIWTEYQRQHDVSDRLGQPVGIDPVSRRIWFGRKALDIARQMRAEGIDRPFYCVRVDRTSMDAKEVVAHPWLLLCSS